MATVRSMMGSVIGQCLPDRSYWAAKRQDGVWLCELDQVDDGQGSTRALDWTLDLVSNGDLTRPGRAITELWLFCPPNQFYPRGQSDRLALSYRHPGFQFKVGAYYAWGEEGRQMEAQLIGRVEDLISGRCLCKVWDRSFNVLANWESSLTSMGTWRDGIAPIGALDLAVLGVRGV